MTSPNVLDELEWRGLIAHSTDRDALRAALGEGSVKFYVGFDPTAPSLHMGNLVQLVTARRLQDAGHTPYILVGGATGMIGDPRDSGERTLNSLDTVKEWTERVREQVSRFVSFEGGNAATMVNNYDWTASLSMIDFLRDIGKHFPVNRMLARDTVKRRLESGISYTEFSYVLLQSMDFLKLFRDHGVTLQFGGSDQWGNITGGAELMRRVDGGARRTRFATPLVTKSDGTKYGKTEGGALWLDPEMLSPYAFHQFWLNVEDEKVGRAAAHLHLPLPRGDRGPRAADGREAVPARRPEAAGRRGHRAGARRRRGRARQGRGRRALRRGRPGRHQARHPRRPRCARPEVRRFPPASCPASSTSSWPPASPRARGRPGAPSPRAAPTSTTCGSRTPSSSPPRPTWSPVPGSCCAAGRRSSPASRSS